MTKYLKQNKVYQYLANAVWQLYYILCSIPYYISGKQAVLVYVGVNRGRGLDSIRRQYKKIIAVEANPVMYDYLVKKFAKAKNITLIHAAAADKAGTATLHLADNDGKSSSLGKVKEELKASFLQTKTIAVPAINLCNTLQQMGITHITHYISDIQGMDLTVLTTMQPYITNKLINYITSEVAKNEYKNIYANIPDNSEAGFEALLTGNYTLCAKGIGLLQPNTFEPIPAHYWEMDCMWQVNK